MAEQTVCPRCGARDSFGKGYLPETCVCRVCQSQLDWREIPGCGPDCRATVPAAEIPASGEETPGSEAAPHGAPAGDVVTSLGGEPAGKGSVDV
jgi:hypothetical protein